MTCERLSTSVLVVERVPELMREMSGCLGGVKRECGCGEVASAIGMPE